MAIDLDTIDPLWLSEISDLDGILDAVKKIERWDESIAQKLDFAYRWKLYIALWDHAHVKEMETLSLHLESVAADASRKKILNGMSEAYATRWLAFQNVLHDRVVARHMEIPEEILNREHVCKIMEQIGEAKYVLQKDLGEKLALKPANLTRILNQLEDWELISRHKVGREKYLTFGPRALDYFPDAGREKRIAAAAAGQNSSSKEMGGIQDVFKSPFPNVVVVDFKSAA